MALKEQPAMLTHEEIVSRIDDRTGQIQWSFGLPPNPRVDFGVIEEPVQIAGVLFPPDLAQHVMERR